MAAAPNPFFRAATNVTARATTINGTKPTGTIQGDLLLAAVRVGGTTMQTPPSGWVLLATSALWSVGVDDATCYLYAKDVTDADLAVTVFTWTFNAAAGFAQVVIGCYGSCSLAASVVSATSNTGSGTTATGLSVDTTLANSLVALFGFNDSAGTWTNTLTERNDASGATLADTVQAAAGASGNKTATIASAGWQAFLVAVSPNLRARRFYIDGAAAGAISPAYEAVWNTSASAVRRQGKDVKGASAKADVTIAEAVTTNNYDVACVQVVIGPLGTGVLHGGWRAQVRCAESSANLNAIVQYTVKVCRPDATVRAVAYAGHANTANTNEFGTTAANRRFPRLNLTRALTSTAYCEGDYLVVELGYRANNTSGTSMSGTLRIGESATDFAENDTTTTDNCPWIEFTEGVRLSGEGPELVPGAYIRRV